MKIELWVAKDNAIYNFHDIDKRSFDVSLQHGMEIVLEFKGGLLHTLVTLR